MDTLLIDNINAGIYDAELAEAEAAILARLKELRVSRKSTDFGIGDKIKFNSYCGTKYMVGATGSVVGMRRTKIAVRIDKPIGRFTPSADIVVPPSIIDKI